MNAWAFTPSTENSETDDTKEGNAEIVDEQKIDKREKRLQQERKYRQRLNRNRNSVTENINANFNDEGIPNIATNATAGDNAGSGGNGGGTVTQILNAIGETFAPAKVIGYRALNQYDDPELGLSDTDDSDDDNQAQKLQKSKTKSKLINKLSVKHSQQIIGANKSNVNTHSATSNDSSDLEELFPKSSKSVKQDKTKVYRHHQRKARRKMTAKTYTLRDNAENSMQIQMKNSKLRIILGVIFALVVLSGFAVGLYFLLRDASSNDSPSDNRNTIKLPEILNGQISVNRFNGSWSDGKSLIYKDNLTIVEFNTKTKRRNVILQDERKQYFSYEKSADGQLLLLAKNYKKNFRYSYEAEYDIYNLTSGQIYPLTINGLRSIVMAQWAPVGNAMIVNFELNLYYKSSAFAREVVITSDTPGQGIFNGVPDWVYEEEVFNSNTATWFNPNGTQIAFIRIDDSPTTVISFPFYGEPGDLRYQYPYNRLIAYPKSGSPNPRVSLFTADLVRAAQGLDDFLTEIPVPSALNTETDYIISAVTWLTNDNVLSVWMNRIQNVAYLQTFNGRRRYEIYNTESKTGWVDLFQSPLRNREGSRIALILPQKIDSSGDYRHLCTLNTINANSKPEFLTKGRFVVETVLHWDYQTDHIFFTANTEKESQVLHLYAVKPSNNPTPKCLTCKLQISGGVEQTYYSTEFNSEQKIIINSLGPGIPMTAIYEYKLTNNQLGLTKLLDWETNEVLREKLKDKAVPTTEIHTFPIADHFTAKVLLQLPPNIDRSGNTKYPMLVDVYGGPDSYSAVTRFNLDWGTYLSSDQKVIYAKIDGRGTGLRGDKLLHSIYLKLGTVEISDQLNVTRQLQEKLSFIDANHTGIWGWSYGGYAAAMALANDNTHTFRCAASIAPVTDWVYYDSMYTERFMSLPKLNPSGYANSRLSTRANKLRGKKLLLVHGTLDDNVHYQQSLMFAKNLERQDILFKQISYTDEDHSLTGVRPHLYHSLDRFFGECFEHTHLLDA